MAGPLTCRKGALHDVIVVGGSAGALEGVLRLVQGLPTFQASMRVAQHAAGGLLLIVPDSEHGASR